MSTPNVREAALANDHRQAVNARRLKKSDLRAMPRDGGFLREVAARDKLGSQQAGDLYLPVLGAGRHLRQFRVRTVVSQSLAQRARTTFVS